MPETTSDIVVALYQAAAGTATWSDALRLIGDSVDGAFTLIGIVDKTTGRTNSITSEPFDPERKERYRGRYFAVNPRVRHSAATPVGRVFYDAAIGRDAELARHPYYAEYLAERGFTHFVSANLINSPTRRVNLSVQRGRRAGHVDRQEVKKIEAIVPHAIAAFDLWERLQRVSMQERLLLEAWSEIDAGILVLDEYAQLLFANDAGKILLGPLGPLKLDGGALGALSGEANDRFADLIRAAHGVCGEAASSRPGRMTLWSAARQPFIVSARPMPDFIRLDGLQRPSVLVVATPARPLSTADDLQRLLGLTAGEAALALALADGKELSDHARELTLAPEVARARLVSLRRKLAAADRVPVARALREAERYGPPGATVLEQPLATPAWALQYNLTPAEARLAAYLLNRGTAPTYAAEHGLSPHTVRNQLRSIYGKTNTNRQVSLLQLLLRASGKNP